MDNTEKEKVQNFLFYLGKGLWKSIPVLGPIIEEVLYEQFKEALTNRVSRLSEENIQLIAQQIPQQGDLEKLDKHLDGISEEIKLVRANYLSEILLNLENFSDKLMLRKDWQSAINKQINTRRCVNLSFP